MKVNTERREEKARASRVTNYKAKSAKYGLTPATETSKRVLEPPELLLMIEAVHRWVAYEHRHKSYIVYDLIKVAARCLGLRANPKTNCWEFSWQTPVRLFAMGIDSKTFQIINEKAFRWAWYQFGHYDKWTITRQRELMASGKEPPLPEPLAFGRPAQTYKEIREKIEKKKIPSSHMAEEIINHFFV